MSRVITRGLRKKLELEASQQPVHKVIQPQEETHFQAEGIQLVEIPSNEPQQPITT
jgi:hypothetical protein